MNNFGIFTQQNGTQELKKKSLTYWSMQQYEWISKTQWLVPTRREFMFYDSWFEIQEQEKLIYGNRNQKSSFMKIVFNIKFRNDLLEMFSIFSRVLIILILIMNYILHNTNPFE